MPNTRLYSRAEQIHQETDPNRQTNQNRIEPNRTDVFWFGFGFVYLFRFLSVSFQFGFFVSKPENPPEPSYSVRFRFWYPTLDSVLRLSYFLFRFSSRVGFCRFGSGLTRCSPLTLSNSNNYQLQSKQQ
jgi:hypothetical protein